MDLLYVRYCGPPSSSIALFFLFNLVFLSGEFCLDIVIDLDVWLCFSVVDFLKEMPQFSLKAGHVLSNLYGPDWEKRLEVVSMCHT